MVDRNRPLAKSYRQSQEEESDEQDEEETMETDSGQESSPPPVRELLMNFIYSLFCPTTILFTFSWIFKISGSKNKSSKRGQFRFLGSWGELFIIDWYMNLMKHTEEFILTY